MKRVAFRGKLVIVGFGSIAQGVLPLILRHIEIEPTRISVITGGETGREIAEQSGLTFHVAPLTKSNYLEVLTPLVSEGDFLLNLSVGVSSVDLIAFCQEKNVLYVDAAIEPWDEDDANPAQTLAQRAVYTMREKADALRPASAGRATAVLAHGANPGIVSHFFKRALLNIGEMTEYKGERPKNRQGWAALAHTLGVKTVHVAEYDSQQSVLPKRLGRFENTWSPRGFFLEGLAQPSELGWGTHEKEMPAEGRQFGFGSGAAIYLERPGALTFVRTWTPGQGQFLGRVIPHNESISIAEYFTLNEGDRVTYRPSVYYAYRPCDAAVLSLEEAVGAGMKMQTTYRVLMEEIGEGVDELGVLVMGHAKGAYWYGSQLSINQARELAPNQNATGLQVTAGVLGGMMWAMEHPREGIKSVDELDFEYILAIVEPYMGRMVGAYTDWTPLAGRSQIFSSDTDPSDPWQFKNFRVV